MTFLTILIYLTLLTALLPALLTLSNLRAYRPLPPPAAAALLPISVLIPARNEGKNIAAAMEAVLANNGVDFELIILDDDSTDDTATLVQEAARRDPRVRLEKAPPLPAGWWGKQHACHILAGLATKPILLFIDADVRLQPGSLARMAAFMGKADAPALASGIPRQLTGSFFEQLLLPLIHFVLLGFLPIERMRRTLQTAMSAGCGQLFVMRKDAYIQAGGHAAIRHRIHDGVHLPRLFRGSGLATDLFDATDLATCRMYQTSAETWHGLSKNAVEAMAAPATIGPMTLLFFCGQVLPFLLLFWAGPAPLVVLACALALLPRLLNAWKFRQPLLSALLHPLGIVVLLAIQWQALWRYLRGRGATWKGRGYQAAAS